MSAYATSWLRIMLPHFVFIAALFASLPSYAACSLSKVEITVGMTRNDVEAGVAAALGITSTYGVYGNNLRGGHVEYKDGHCMLEVEYSPGAPAPSVSLDAGKVQHLLPEDETVLSFKLLAPKGQGRTP